MSCLHTPSGEQCAGNRPLKDERPISRAISRPVKLRFLRRIGYVPDLRAGPPPAAASAGVSLVFRHTRACGAFRQWLTRG